MLCVIGMFVYRSEELPQRTRTHQNFTYFHPGMDMPCLSHL